ncbi:MAG: T9SS type A sorting domain-containing protein [Bacteroidetes bacterium]|nr:T9SS type A sorting domain-containing protein [Bacteroidota bacterium]
MKKFFTIILLALCLPLSAQKLYWADGSSGKLQSHNIDGSGSTSDVLTGLSSGYALAVNLTSDELYWTDFTNSWIKKINLTSSAVTTVLSSLDGLVSPRGIAIDGATDRMFWSDNSSKSLFRATLSGASITQIVSGLTSPGYVAYDPASDKVYFADNGAGVKKIMRCNPDGTGLEDVVTSLNQVWGIAFNSLDNNIYWIDSGIDKIQKGNVSSLPVTKVDVVTGLTGNPRGIVIDALNSLIYWTDNFYQDVKRATTSGASQTQLITGVPYPQGIAINWNSALPVELAGFSSFVDRNKVTLSWSTVKEENNKGFYIQRKSGGEFSDAGFIAGAGNSKQLLNYKFTDVNLSTGSYQYRLKQIDYNGNLKYYNLGNEVSVGIPNQFSLLQNYPNPFNPVTNIEFEIPQNVFVDLKVYDMTGKEVATVVSSSLQAGYHKYAFDASKISSGTYIYRIKAGSFSDTKKMVILK